MNNAEYDIFERLPSGTLKWHRSALGPDDALFALIDLGFESRNEYFAIHTGTKEIFARINPFESSPHSIN